MESQAERQRRIHRIAVAGPVVVGAVLTAALAIGWLSVVAGAADADGVRTVRLLELPQPFATQGEEAIPLELAALPEVAANPAPAPATGANSNSNSTTSPNSTSTSMPGLEPVPATLHLAAAVPDPARALERFEKIEVPDVPENPVASYANASPFMEGDRRELRPIDDRPVGVLAAEARRRAAAGVGGGGGISIGGGDCPDGIGIRGVRRSPIDQSAIPSRLTLAP